MKKKAWLFSMLLSAAVFSAACSDDAGKNKQEELPPPPPSTLSYFISCNSPADCRLDLETEQDAIVSVLYTSIDEQSFNASMVSNAVLNASRTGTVFTMENVEDSTVSVLSDDNGVATVRIHTGAEAGTGSIIFTTAEEGQTADPATFTITVKKAAPVPVVVPEDKDFEYHVTMTYQGEKALVLAESMLFPGQTCADIVRENMESDDVADIEAAGDKYVNLIPLSGITIDKAAFDYKLTEEEKTTYAVVGRVQGDEGYAAYGCTDGLNRDNRNVVVNLGDTYVPEVIVKPDPPQKPEKPEPLPPDPVEPPVMDYSGNFTLTSSFNALSLLPHAVVEEGKAPLFKDMLAGDWIEFVLNFLSDPEKEITNVLTQQLIPLLLDADWFKSLLEKMGASAIVALLDSGALDIDQLMETFGIKKIISDYLEQITGQLVWWDTATGSVKIANEIATNFTMHGSFVMAGKELNEQSMLLRNKHSYNSLLYHNGNFDKCLIGNKFAADVDKKLICEIGLDSLDSGAIKGDFDATFSEIVDGKATVDIAKHNLTLAYGKLIYAALMQILPLVAQPAEGVKLNTIGDVLAYYIGMGLVSIYNKKHEDSPIEKKYGCDAVGEVTVSLVKDNLLNSDKLPDFIKKILSSLSIILQPSIVSLACTAGTSALNNFVNSQLDKLSVSSDKVAFSSDDCNLNLVMVGEYPASISSFGMDSYDWGSKVDKRCKWKVSIQANEESEAKTIDGKFYAFRNKE